MVLSWLTAINNRGSFVFSLNRRRHTSSLLKRAFNSNQSKTMFVLAVPIHGMEALVRRVGSTSGRMGSKFSADCCEQAGGDETDPVAEAPPPETDCSGAMRQPNHESPSLDKFDTPAAGRKKSKQGGLASSGGVQGLRAIPVGMRAFSNNGLEEEQLFAVDGTVAHLVCRIDSILDIPHRGRSGSPGRDSSNLFSETAAEELHAAEHVSSNAVPSDDQPRSVTAKRACRMSSLSSAADNDHDFVIASVVRAYVHPSYWDSQRNLFYPQQQEATKNEESISQESDAARPMFASGGIEEATPVASGAAADLSLCPPPYLSFFGSQMFGHVVPFHESNGNK
jgi:hypothetical protein